MFRKFALTASAVALVAGGLGFSSGGSAFAAKPTITANTGSDIHCDITASVKLNPALKDNWVKADHQANDGETNVDVQNIANTTYAPPAPEHVNVKGAGTCTGSVTQDGGATTYNVTKVKITLEDEASNPTTDPGSCLGLFVDDGNPSVARYKAVIAYTSPTAKVVSSTITHAEITSSFGVTGGTISGSFAGGSSTAQGVPDGTTVAIFLDENDANYPNGKTATSASPAAPNVCQAGLKIKPGSATLKAPKGLKKLSMVAGSIFDIQKP